MIEIRHLRYFVAVSEELHFGRAAERLHITQPPLSQAIRKLEDDLGVELLRRTSRVVALTEAGRAFADEARKVIASFDRAVAGARRAAEQTVTLQIACVPYLPVERLLAFVTELRRRAPGVAVQVAHLFTPDQLRGLRDGSIDVGLLAHPADEAELELRPIFGPEPLAVFVPADHPLAARGVLTPADLRGERLVAFPRASDGARYDVVLDRLARAGYSFSGVLEAGGPTARDVFLAVAEGRGVAVAGSSLRYTSGAARLVGHRPLDPPVDAPETVLAWAAEPSSVVRPLLETLRSVAADLRADDAHAGTDGGS